MGEAKRRRELATRQPDLQLPKQMTLPERVLESAAKGFDGFWKLVEMLRQKPTILEGTTGPWNPWCYIPVNAVNGIVAHLLRDRMSSAEVERNLVSPTRLLTAVAGWRMTKAVYVFDPSVVKAMAETEVEEDLPDDLFFHLPDWCPYVSTPDLQIREGLYIHGFFAYVDDRAHGNRQYFPPELNFEILVDPQRSSAESRATAAMFDPEFQFIVHEELEKGTLESADMLPRFAELGLRKEFLHMHMNVPLGQGKFTKAFLEQSQRIAQLNPEGLMAQSIRSGNTEDVEWVTHYFGQLQARLGGLLLYLVSDKPDISPDSGQTALRDNVVSKERRGIRTFQAPRVTAWDVGFRIGAEIRAFEKAQESGRSTGSGSGMRPHVRKAHWHAFWTGRRDQPQERKRRVRWLPPIPVKVSDSDDLVPTMHKVVK